MKKRFSLILSLCLMLSCIIPITAPVSAEVTGAGTTADPYKIPIIKDVAVGRGVQQRTGTNAGAYMAFAADVTGAAGETAYALLELDLTQIPSDDPLGKVEFVFFTTNGVASNAKIYLTTASWEKTGLTWSDVSGTLINDMSPVAEVGHKRYDTEGVTRVNIAPFVTGNILENNNTITLIYEFSAASTIVNYFGSEYTGTNDNVIAAGPPHVLVSKLNITGTGTAISPYKIPIIKDRAVGRGVALGTGASWNGAWIKSTGLGAGNAYAIMDLDLSLLPEQDLLENMNVKLALHTADGGKAGTAQIYMTNDLSWQKYTITAEDIDNKITNDNLQPTTSVLQYKYAGSSNFGLTNIELSQVIRDTDMLDNSKHETFTLIYKFDPESIAIYYLGSEHTGTEGSEIHNGAPYVTMFNMRSGEGTAENPYIRYADKSKASFAQTAITNQYLTGTRGVYYAIYKVNISDLYTQLGTKLSHYNLKARFASTNSAAGNTEAQVYVTDALWDKATITGTKMKELADASAAKGIKETYTMHQYDSNAQCVKTVDLGYALSELDISTNKEISIIVQYGTEANTAGARFFGEDCNLNWMNTYDAFPRIILTAPDVSDVGISSLADKKYEFADTGVPMGVVFANAPADFFGGLWTRDDIGMIFSETGAFGGEEEIIPYDEANGQPDINGNYGFKFIGTGLELDTTYYAKPYAIYTSPGEEPITVYGAVISFTPTAADTSE